MLAKLPEQGGHAAVGELSTERLTELLKEAERAHGAFEKELGRRDEAWPAWYAQYIVDRLSGD